MKVVRLGDSVTLKVRSIVRSNGAWFHLNAVSSHRCDENGPKVSPFVLVRFVTFGSDLANLRKISRKITCLHRIRSQIASVSCILSFIEISSKTSEW